MDRSSILTSLEALLKHPAVFLILSMLVVFLSSVLFACN